MGECHETENAFIISASGLIDKRNVKGNVHIFLMQTNQLTGKNLDIFEFCQK